MHYLALIEKEAGTLYGGWFPDCPGAASAGETMDECAQSALASLRSWATDAVVSGDDLPAPRSLDELMRDADVAESIKCGAVTLAVPLIVDKGRQARVNVSLDVGTLEAIDEGAKRSGMTRSAFMAEAAIRRLDELV